MSGDREGRRSGGSGGSAPDRLGLKNGDELLQLNGVALDSASQALKAWHVVRKAKSVTLKLRRDGEREPRMLRYTIE